MFVPLNASCGQLNQADAMIRGVCSNAIPRRVDEGQIVGDYAEIFHVNIRGGHGRTHRSFLVELLTRVQNGEAHRTRCLNGTATDHAATGMIDVRVKTGRDNFMASQQH